MKMFNIMLEDKMKVKNYAFNMILVMYSDMDSMRDILQMLAVIFSR